MNRIRQLRKQKHIGQMEFAKLMGVSQPTVSDWENGRKHPSSGKLVRLSEVLGASISYILGSDLYDEGVAESIPAAEPDAVAPAPAPVASTPAADPRAYEKIVYEKDDINPDIVPIGEKFMMRVFDNSMKPRIQENDYIVVLRQDEAENGALMLLQERLHGRIRAVGHHVPVIKSGALEVLIAQRIAQRLDQMQHGAGCGAAARDVAGILRDFGVDQYDIERQSGSPPVCFYCTIRPASAQGLIAFRRLRWYNTTICLSAFIRR